jgi:hypothetical protein
MRLHNRGRQAALFATVCLVFVLGPKVGLTQPPAERRPPLTPSITGGEAVPDPLVEAWARTAIEFRAKNGHQAELVCPAGGSLGSVWGNNPYTDDSSVCSAAVHAGLVDARQGGHVLISICEGRQAYTGNHRNGVKSMSYGPFSGSFSFPQAGLDLAGTPPPPPQDVTWNTNAIGYRGQIGQLTPFDCPPAGRIGSVWGNNPYTDDSSVCSAGVHAGVISMAEGGRVEIVTGPGKKAFDGCPRNRVRSRSWGVYGGSYTVLGGQTDCAVLSEMDGEAAIDWQTTASELPGRPGQRLRLHCPPGEPTSTIWGANPYTDDSGVCAAAVHTGVLHPAEGGLIEIEILPAGQGFVGSLRHGVKSHKWGNWGRTFQVLE